MSAMSSASNSGSRCQISKCSCGDSRLQPATSSAPSGGKGEPTLLPGIPGKHSGLEYNFIEGSKDVVEAAATGVGDLATQKCGACLNKKFVRTL